MFGLMQSSLGGILQVYTVVNMGQVEELNLTLVLAPILTTLITNHTATYLTI